MRTGSERFRLIFFDLSVSYIDVCFSPDSKSLVAIPARFPSFLFLLHLPSVSTSPPASTSNNANSLSQASVSTESNSANSGNFNGKSKFSKVIQSSLSTDNPYEQEMETSGGNSEGTISFEPRPCGPLSILGPARGYFGKPLVMTHIASNTYDRSSRVPDSDKEDSWDPEDNYSFVTWNDDCIGEYCLWRLEVRTRLLSFVFFFFSFFFARIIIT